MRGNGKLFRLESDLMAVQKELARVKAERDAMAKKIGELQAVVASQEVSLSKCLFFSNEPIDV